MTRKLLKDTCTVAAEIMDGEHDSELSWIVQAVQARKHNMFKPNTKVRLVGCTKNPSFNGQVGVVTKVNARTVSVGIGDSFTDQFGTSYTVGEYNVDPALLELV